VLGLRQSWSLWHLDEPAVRSRLLVAHWLGAATIALAAAGCGGDALAPPAATATAPASASAPAMPSRAATATASAPAPATPSRAATATATATTVVPSASPTPPGVPWFRPRVDATWQWQLTGDMNTEHSADIYDIDLFDAPAAVFAALHAAGRRVICYFSAGSHEDWRADAGAFPADVIGMPLGDWPGEHWLDIRSPAVMSVLAARLDLARDRGCDGVEPDNVDGFAAETGFLITGADQVAFNRALAAAAHQRGLAVGLKNAPELIPALVDAFDFAVTEQCHEQGWCADVAPFIAAGKPVFDAEYAASVEEARSRAGEVCTEAGRLGIATLVLPLELDGTFRVACPPSG